MLDEAFLALLGDEPKRRGPQINTDEYRSEEYKRDS
jgi:hypothetical protein